MSIPNSVVRNLAQMSVADFHEMILTRNADHSDIETACQLRIASIPRAPLGRDGRWWHYPMSHAYPFGN